jgi:hypothetical protein
VKVKDIVFADGTPVAARWETKDGMEGSIGFDYLVDASGKQGLVVRLCSTRQNTRLLPGILSEIPLCTLVHTIPPKPPLQQQPAERCVLGLLEGRVDVRARGAQRTQQCPMV